MLIAPFWGELILLQGCLCWQASFWSPLCSLLAPGAYTSTNRLAPALWLPWLRNQPCWDMAPPTSRLKPALWLHILGSQLWWHLPTSRPSPTPGPSRPHRHLNYALTPSTSELAATAWVRAWQPTRPGPAMPTRTPTLVGLTTTEGPMQPI